jgi:hypothetical protein
METEMIDFSKLNRPRSAEERATEDRRLKEQAVKDDHARRLELSKHSLAISLTEEPEGYFTFAGTRRIRIRGLDNRNRPVRVDWFAPEFLERSEVAEKLLPLTAGAVVRIKGYWKLDKHSGASKTFTFVAQFVEPS